MSPVSIATELRTQLMAGKVRPGAELSQVELAERFGVSRIPIRDALRILAGEGLIEFEPNRGARAISLSTSEIREIYDIRLLLECDALRRSAERMTADDLDEIDRVRHHAEIDAVTARWSEGDWAFHRALYEYAGRPRQLAMIEGLRRTCQLFVGAYASMPLKTPQWLDDHSGIVKHLRDGDREGAIAVLSSHLRAAADHLVDRMAEHNAQQL